MNNSDRDFLIRAAQLGVKAAIELIDAEVEKVAAAERVKKFKKKPAAPIEPTTSINRLELSVRSRKVLLRSDVKTLADASKLTESDIRSFRGVGSNTVDEIRAVLASAKLSLADEYLPVANVIA